MRPPGTIPLPPSAAQVLYLDTLPRKPDVLENSGSILPSGLCIDLLRKFEDELGFHYDLVKVADPKWGTFQVSECHNSSFSFFARSHPGEISVLLFPVVNRETGRYLTFKVSCKNCAQIVN